MLRYYVFLIVSLLGVNLMFAQAPSSGVKGWSVQTYRFPASALVHGFNTTEGLHQGAPSLPATSSTDEEVAAFILHSDLTVREYLKTLQISLSEGSLAIFDPANFTLSVRTNTEGHRSVAAAAKALMERVPKNIRFALSLVSVEENLARQVIEATLGRQDHSVPLAKLQGTRNLDPLKHEAVRQLEFLTLETRSGVTSLVQSGETREQSNAPGGDAREISPRDTATKNVGSRLEIDPVYGPDGKSIDVSYRFEHCYRLPQDRLIPVPVAGETHGKIPSAAFFKAEVISSQTWLDGQARLIGVWNPEISSVSGQRRLLVAYAQAKIISLLDELDATAERLLKTYGDQVRATPSEAVDRELSPPLATRHFVVPRSSTMNSFPVGEGAGKVQTEGAQTKALKILQSRGIDFPEGSSATFNLITGELIVHNTLENLQKVQEFLESLVPKIPVNLSFSLHIVQGDGPFLRSMVASSLKDSNHGLAWDSIREAVSKGQAKMVRTFWMGSRSGLRSKQSAGREYRYFSAMAPPSIDADPDQKGEKGHEVHSQPNRPPTEFLEVEKLGLHAEIEGILQGQDQRFVDVSLAMVFHFAQPTTPPLVPRAVGKSAGSIETGPRFHRFLTESSFTMVPGMMRIVGLWKPEGTPEYDEADIFHIAFLRADVENGKTSQD